MLGSEVLDVAIGLAFVYFLLSLVCSAVREMIEAILKRRAVHLERGIRELLEGGRPSVGPVDSPPSSTSVWPWRASARVRTEVSGETSDLVAALYNHPLVSGLFRGTYDSTGRWGRTRWPSYIPSRSFALALFDLAVRHPTSVDADDTALSYVSLSHARMRLDDASSGNGSTGHRALATIFDAAQYDANRALAGIEDWYNSTMDRVAGWYKRETQWILLGVGLLIAGLMNVDTIAIARHLYHNRAARSAIVAQASTLTPDPQLPSRLAAVNTKLAELNLPLGWGKPSGTVPRSSFPERILGWLLTTFAITLGAPFWFDLLNKMMVIRSTVKPNEKSPNEGSEDRASGQRTQPAPNSPRWFLPSGAVDAASHGDVPRGPGAEGELH